MRSVVLLMALGISLIVAACGARSGNAAAPVATTAVSMAKSYRFDPVAIRVSEGATVTWTNQDNFTHNIRLLDGSDWRSDPLRPGQSASHIFQKAGEYTYECAFHPQDMKGTVLVVGS